MFFYDDQGRTCPANTAATGTDSGRPGAETPIRILASRTKQGIQLVLKRVESCRSAYFLKVFSPAVGNGWIEIINETRTVVLI